MKSMDASSSRRYNQQDCCGYERGKGEGKDSKMPYSNFSKKGGKWRVVRKNRRNVFKGRVFSIRNMY